MKDVTENYEIVDRVTKQTGDLLDGQADALAWGDDHVYVLEVRDGE